MLCISVCVKAAVLQQEERGGKKNGETRHRNGKKKDVQTEGGRSGRETGRGSSQRVGDLIGVLQRERGDSRQEEEEEKKKKARWTQAIPKTRWPVFKIK